MNRSVFFASALLAGPVASLLPELNRPVRAESVLSLEDLYVSRPYDVQILGQTVSVRVGVRVVKQGNSGRDPLCRVGQVPDSISLEVLDAVTLKNIGPHWRFFTRFKEGVVDFYHGSTGGCTNMRAYLKVEKAQPESISLHYYWDGDRGLTFDELKDLVILDGERFVRVSH